MSTTLRDGQSIFGMDAEGGTAARKRRQSASRCMKTSMSALPAVTLWNTTCTERCEA